MLLEYAQNNASNMNAESQQALGTIISQFTEIIRMQSNQPPPIEEIEQEEAEAVQQITGQGQQRPPPPSGQAPQVEPAPFESSNINGFKYNPETEELYVKFQGKYPSQSGPVYSYQGVPGYIFDIFSRGAVAPKTSGRNAWHEWKRGVTPSHGAAMAALIKAGRFPYQRLS